MKRFKFALVALLVFSATLSYLPFGTPPEAQAQSAPVLCPAASTTGGNDGSARMVRPGTNNDRSDYPAGNRDMNDPDLALYSGNSTGGTITETPPPATANFTITEGSAFHGYNKNRNRAYTTPRGLVLWAFRNPGIHEDVAEYEYKVDNITPGFQPATILRQPKQPGGNSEYSIFTISWTGGVGDAYYNDPDPVTPATQGYKFASHAAHPGLEPGFNWANNQIVGLDNNGTIANGGTFGVYAINNKDSRWSVAFPVGATNIKIKKAVATGGTKKVDNFSTYAGGEGIDALYPVLGMQETGRLGESYHEWIEVHTDLIECEVPAPAMTLTKTASSTTATTAGTQITYTFVQTNTGNTSFTSPSISDALCDAAPTIQSESKLPANGILDYGENITWTCTRTLTQADIDSGSLVNTATATGTPANSSGTASGGTFTDPTDTATVNFTANPAVVLTKETPSTPTHAGHTLLYTFKAKNTGNVTIANPTLTDPKCAAAPALVSEVGGTAGNSKLDVGETITYTCTSIPVTQTEVDAGVVSNTATFSGDPAQGTLTPVETTKDVTIAANPSMTLSKASTDTNPQVGSSVNYTFTLTNTGNLTINNPAIRDPKCNAAGAAITAESGTVAGVLEVGEVITFSCTSKPVTQAEVDAGTVPNSATATGTPNRAGATEISATDNHTIPVAPVPGIQLNKTTTSSVAQAGDTPNYTFKLTNTGNVTLDSPTVTDPKCGAAPALVSEVGGTAGNSKLDVGETITYTCTSIPVTQAEVDAGKVDNTAIGSGTTPSGVTITDNSTATITVTPAPAWTLTKAAETAPAQAGDTIIYNFTLVNTGNVSITPTVTDAKCASAITLKPETSGTRTGVLEPGETQIWTCSSVPVTQADIDLGYVDNVAKANGTIDSGTAVSELTDTHRTTITANPNWALVKTTASEPTAAGQTLDYTFRLTNTGNVTINTPGITDPKCDPATPPTITNQTGGIADNAKLDVGETITYTCTSVPVTQAEVDAGVVKNTATPTGTPTGGTLPNITKSVDRLIAAQPAFTLAKATNSTPTSAGETLDYTFTLTNTGNVTINNPAVADDKCAAAPLIVTESDTTNAVLEVGEIITFSCTSIPVTQTEIDAGQIANTATATGDPVAGSLTPATADLTITVDPNPKWTFVKSTSSTPTQTGDTLTYRFTIVNQGNVTINNPTITDAKCASAFTPAITSVAPGQTAVIECSSVPVTDAEVNAGRVLNTATLDGTTPAGTAMGQLTSSTETPIAATPSFKLTKAAQAPLPTKAGQSVNYVFTLVNDGNVQINSPSISDAKCTAAPTITNETRTTDTNLEIGETITFGCSSGPVTQAEIDAGFIDNTATATGTPVRGSLTDVTDTHRITVPADPSTSLSKAVDRSPTAAGETLTYTFELTNTGNVTISNPAINDAKCAAAATITTESATTDGVLEVGETITFTCTSVPVEQSEIDAGVITNTATGSGTPTRGTLTDSTASITTTIDANPAFELTKAANEAITAAGETPTYTFTLTNTGNVTISNPAINDQKCDAAGLTLTNESITAADNVLEVGETNTYTCTSIPVDQSEVDAGEVVNNATASGTPARGDLPDATAQHIATIAPKPNMTIVKTATTAPLKAGDTIDYKFVVQNTGNVTIETVSVTDAKCASGPDKVSESQTADEQLSPGEFFTFTCTSEPITQTEVDAGVVTNTATANGTPVNGALIDPVPETTHNTPVPASPSYSAAKTTTGTVSGSGDTLTYKIEVKNTGNVTIDPLVVTDPKCQADPAITGESITVDGRLEVGEVITYECESILVTQPEIDAGEVTNTASVTGTPARGELEPLTPSDTQPIEPNPAWTLNKSSASVVSKAGDTATYSFTVVNTGNVTITGVNITDAKCATTPVLKQELSGTPNNNKLDVGETQIYECDSIAVTQAEIDAGVVLNTATANGTPAGGTLAQLSDDHTIRVQPAPKWTLAKTSTTTPTAADDSIKYRFTLVNNGNVTISNVDLSDAKCATAITMVDEIGATAGNNKLDPGEIQIYECDSVAVTQAEVNAGFADNTVDATGIPAHGDLTPATDDHRVNIAARPNWTLAKQALSTATQAGQTVDYSFTLTNTGNVDITAVSVTDAKCGSAPALTASDASSDSVLSPGEIWNYTCTSRPLTQAEVDSGSFTNTAEATGTPARSTLSPTDSTVTITIDPDPKFELVKTTDSQPEQAGHVLTYRFELTNTGNVSINDPKIEDAKCAAAATIAEETITSDGILQPGETITFTCDSVAVTQAEVDAGKVLNTAKATGTPAGGTLTPQEATHEKPITARSAWELQKAPVEQPTKAGDIIKYRFTLINTGNVTITNPKIEDAKCVSAPTIETESINANSILEFGETITFTCNSVAVTQAEADAGVVINTATATGDNPNGPMTRLERTHRAPIVPMPSFDLVKSTQSIPGNAGDTLFYTFKLTNTGNVTINEPKITDAKCVSAPAIETESATKDGVLDVGEIITFTCRSKPVTQSEVDAGVVTNTATATGKPIAGDLTDVTSKVDVAINATPNASLTKITKSAPQRAGDTLIYTFVTTNTGNVTLNRATIDDPKCGPAVQLVSESMTSDSILEVGETAIFECVSVPVTQAEVDAGKVDNTGRLVATPAGGTLPEITASTSTDIPNQPNWEITMTTDTPIREVGTTLEYEFTILNTGNTTLTDVELATTKCATTPTLVSGDPTALKPLETLVYKCTSTPVTQDEVDNGVVPNEATATASTPSGAKIKQLQTSTITPAAKPDEKLNLAAGKIVELSPLTNDAGSLPLEPTSLGIIDPTTGALVKQLTVPGEGIWIVKSNGTVIFTPESPSVSTPTPVRYEALTTDGKRITSTMTITYVRQAAGEIKDEVSPVTQPATPQTVLKAVPVPAVQEVTPTVTQEAVTETEPLKNLVHTGAESHRLLMWACLMISLGSSSMAAARRRAKNNR